MPSDSLVSLTEVLQTTGGWGVAAVFLLLFWRERKASDNKDERIFNLLDKQAEILKLLDRFRGAGS